MKWMIAYYLHKETDMIVMTYDDVLWSEYSHDQYEELKSVTHLFSSEHINSGSSFAFMVL